MAHRPDDAEALLGLGIAYQDQGRVADAVVCYLKAAAVEPDLAAAYKNFALLMKGRRFPQPPDASLRVRETLIACLLRRDLDPQDLLEASLSLLLPARALAAISAYVADTPPTNAELTFTRPGPVRDLLRDRLLHSLAKNTILASAPIEALLSTVRRSLLLYLVSADVDEAGLRSVGELVYSLAHQGFWNEYAFYESPQEQAALPKLVQAAEDAVAGDDRNAHLFVALLASYRSLSRFGFVGDLPTSHGLFEREELRQLMELQVWQPRQEQQLAAQIPVLREIRDDLSKDVQRHYEENPYPRWIATYEGDPVSLVAKVRSDIHPSCRLEAGSLDAPRILVAGCGTGRQPIEIAALYRDASVLAIDLSRVSLAYAKRRADALGITNVEFLQADLLDLTGLGEKFDVIACGGVLHHLDDPQRGWSILADLLRSKGLMKIGLYSALARSHCTAARKWVEQRGYGPTPEDIRRCRRDLLDLPDGHAAKQVTLGLSFYSTSLVRDLLFHPREHLFTLPQISEILAQLNLRMLGFILPPDRKRQYLSVFPDDADAVSFDDWNRFEHANPHVFANLYQFWVQRRD